MKRIQFYLDDDVYALLLFKAKTKGLDPSAYVRSITYTELNRTVPKGAIAELLRNDEDASNDDK